MAFQLGPLGGLRSLPDPAMGLDASTVRLGAVHRSLGGRATVDTLAHRRSWPMAWDYLTDDDLAYVRALHLRLVSGDLRFVDPNQRNRLSAQASGGGSYLRDTTGFTATTGTISFATIASPAAALSGLLAGGISWVVPVTGGGTLRADDTDQTTRMPTVPGEQYTASLYVYTTTSGVTVQAIAQPYDTAGAAGTALAGSSTALTASTWTRITHTWTASSTDVAIAPGVKVATGNPAHTLLATGWQIERAAAAAAWVPGAGCPLVVLDQLPDRYPMLGYHDSGLTLLEV